ncbi:MAG: GAF domain-containing protein [bacterium]
MNDIIKKELDKWLTGERDFIMNASNFAAILFNNLPDANWVGFYMLSEGDLILGPFQGKPARRRIAIGEGVCGYTAAKKESVIVPNVSVFEGHIVCDCVSQSEICIPLMKDGVFFGLLDIDSPQLDMFTEEDKNILETFVELLINSSDMDKIKNYYK